MKSKTTGKSKAHDKVKTEIPTVSKANQTEGHEFVESEPKEEIEVESFILPSFERQFTEENDIILIRSNLNNFDEDFDEDNIIIEA